MIWALVALLWATILGAWFLDWRSSSGRCSALKGSTIRCSFGYGHRGPHKGREYDYLSWTHWNDASSSVDSLIRRTERTSKIK